MCGRPLPRSLGRGSFPELLPKANSYVYYSYGITELMHLHSCGFPIPILSIPSVPKGPLAGPEAYERLLNANKLTMYNIGALDALFMHVGEGSRRQQQRRHKATSYVASLHISRYGCAYQLCNIKT